MHIGFIEVPIITIPLIIAFTVSDEQSDLLAAFFLTILIGVAGVTVLFLCKFTVVSY
jgi:hypothetical protein